MRQEKIRYAQSRDGVKLAWIEAGQGERTLILAPNGGSNITEDWDNPAVAPVLRAMCPHFRVIRFDERGFANSSREVEHSLELWSDDIEAVADAAGCAEAFVLHAGSAATFTAATFAARAPERLSHLLLYGGKANGAHASGVKDLIEHADARQTMLRYGYENNDVGALSLTFAYLARDITDDERAFFVNRPMTNISTVDNAMRRNDVATHADVRPILGAIKTPTLVGHARGDEATAFALGQKLAQRIPGSTFVAIDSNNHILRPTDGSLDTWTGHVLDFVYGKRNDAAPLDTLSRRERDIVECLCDGLTNDAIAARLGLSEKTVRNQLTLVFEKLGVGTRTQAVIAAMKQRSG